MFVKIKGGCSLHVLFWILDSLFAKVQEQNVTEKLLNLNRDTKTSLFRRELKISGSIGHPNETNKFLFP